MAVVCLPPSPSLLPPLSSLLALMIAAAVACPAVWDLCGYVPLALSYTTDLLLCFLFYVPPSLHLENPHALLVLALFFLLILIVWQVRRKDEQERLIGEAMARIDQEALLMKRAVVRMQKTWLYDVFSDGSSIGQQCAQRCFEAWIHHAAGAQNQRTHP